MTNKKLMSACCEYCDGTGVVFALYPDVDDYVEEDCPICKGTGIKMPCQVKEAKEVESG